MNHQSLFSQILGHKPQLQALQSSQSGQAYLFTGPSGIGKKRAALALAQKILCPKPESPCGICPSCTRVSKLSHPDLFLLFPEEVTIKIDNIREIQNFVNLRSFEKHGKVVIIDECQKMTPQSANAILKTLEEPPENTHFILLSSNKGAVLSTIQSRCQKMHFGALDLSDVKKLAPDSPPWALELSQGRMDLLEKWTDESKKDLRHHFFQMFKDLPHSRAFEGFQGLELLNNEKETALFTLLLFNHWIKMILSIKLGVAATGPAEEIQAFNSLAQHFEIQDLLKLSTAIVILEKDIHANVNKKLAFENFWLDLRRAVKGS